MTKSALESMFLDRMGRIAAFGKADAFQVRFFSSNLKNSGFVSGLKNGLNATNDAFDVPKLDNLRRGHAGLELDVKALRSDVRKAKAKLTRQTANAAG